MAELKINHFSIQCYGKPAGSVGLSDGRGASISFQLTEDEVNQLFGLGYSFFQARQEELSKQVAEVSVPLLAAPHVVEAEFSPVTDSGDIPL